MHKEFNSLAKYIKVKESDYNSNSFNSHLYSLSYEDFKIDVYVELDDKDEFIFMLYEGSVNGDYTKSYTHDTLNYLLDKYKNELNITYDINMHNFYNHDWSFVSKYEIQKQSIYFAFWYLFYTCIIMTKENNTFDKLSHKTKKMFLHLIYLEDKILKELPREYLTKDHA